MSIEGRFITLEGSEGAGKTSAMETLTEVLTSWHVPFITTREPGGEPTAELIRNILLNSEHLDNKTELLLMFAARNEHLVKKIRPALKSGVWVVSDRFVDASFAYQGMGRGIDWSTIEYLESMTVKTSQPDLTLYLDVDPAVGLQRAADRSDKDRIEKEGLSFFKNIRNGYLKRFESCSQRICKIDANSSINDVKAEIKRVMSMRKKDLLR